MQVIGLWQAAYNFVADSSKTVSITLQNLLYVPDCPIRLICPWHIAEPTGNAADGFNSLKDKGILTIHNEENTNPYHKGPGLPLLPSAPGVETFQAYLSIPDSDYSAARAI